VCPIFKAQDLLGRSPPKSATPVQSQTPFPGVIIAAQVRSEEAALPWNDPNFDPKVFTDVLIADVFEAEERAHQHDTASSRRDLVRTALAGAEGLLWFFRVQLFKHRRTVASVTPLELDAIFERSYTVAENGAVRQVSRYLPSLSTYRLLTRVIQRDFPSFNPDFHGEGWSRMKAAVEIRNRITHPKAIEDLNVSMEDAQNAKAAFFWTWGFVLRAVQAGAFVQQKIEE
jgi:hypothetical protein